MFLLQVQTALLQNENLLVSIHGGDRLRNGKQAELSVRN